MKFGRALAEAMAPLGIGCEVVVEPRGDTAGVVEFLARELK